MRAQVPNATCSAVGFEYLQRIRAVVPKIRGAANKARFAVWHSSLEYFAQLVGVELAATKLAESLANISRPNETIVQKRAIAAAAIPKLVALSRAWENMTTSLQQTVMSAGTLGTLATNDANMYVRNFPFNATLALLAELRLPIPEHALPSASYLGPTRLFVRTVRTVVARDERTLSITATLLVQPATVGGTTVRLNWRMMGGTGAAWHVLTLAQPNTPGRGLYTFSLPVPADDFEWYMEAQIEADEALVFPPGWADEKETVTVVVM